MIIFIVLEKHLAVLCLECRKSKSLNIQKWRGAKLTTFRLRLFWTLAHLLIETLCQRTNALMKLSCTWNCSENYWIKSAVLSTTRITNFKIILSFYLRIIIERVRLSICALCLDAHRTPIYIRNHLGMSDHLYTGLQNPLPTNVSLVFRVLKSPPISPIEDLTSFFF